MAPVSVTLASLATMVRVSLTPPEPSTVPLMVTAALAVTPVELMLTATVSAIVVLSAVIPIAPPVVAAPVAERLRRTEAE